jgi:hypothetical protein
LSPSKSSWIAKLAARAASHSWKWRALDAQAAIAQTNGFNMGGRPLRVNEAQERPARGPRPGGGGGYGGGGGRGGYGGGGGGRGGYGGGGGGGYGGGGAGYGGGNNY